MGLNLLISVVIVVVLGRQAAHEIGIISRLKFGPSNGIPRTGG